MANGHPKATSAAIELRGVSKMFDDRSGRVAVLENIDLTIEPQSFVCLVGPSGCGKTTLLRILAGLEQPSDGEVVFPEKRLPRVGLVFQDSSLMPWRTVLDNILLPLEVSGTEPQAARQRALHLAELVGLSDFIGSWPASLSGGMAQRVAIARALIQDPDMLLLDEPFGALDALTRDQMGVELLRVWQSRKKTVVMVTHAISEALLLADRVIVLSDRPAQVRADVNVDVPRPRHETARYKPEFINQARRLRAMLR